MPELRWTLLVLGVLFLAGLALWESRRGRQVRQADLERLAGGTAVEPRERDLRERDLDESELPLPSFSARDPEREPATRPLPVYELPVAEPAAPGRRLDPILDFAGDPLVAEESGPVISDFEPGQAEVPVGADGQATFVDDFEIGPVRVIDPPTLAPQAQTMAPHQAAAAPVEAQVLEAVPAVPAAAVMSPAAAISPAEPIVDWPDPAQSRIVSVRILAPHEKFQGRAVRLALTAQGFVPGKFSIYHKPAHDGRALLSVASLTKPGTFDGTRVDLQRFSGLNLFTVLPGPLPAADAVDELLHCAGILAARLSGVLQDEQGQPLSALRVEQLRATAAASAS